LTNGAVLVFARRPELGQVKTRLESAIGNQLTLLIYKAFLADTLIAARQANARVILAHTPGPAFPEQALADDTFPQQGHTFGERFDFALKEAANRLPVQAPLLLIGADTPHLSPIFLRKTLQALTHYEGVIGPNTNGGFYLLGFSKPTIPVREVFNHSPAEEVRELARMLGKARLRYALLEPNFDIDFPEDLWNLICAIKRLEASGAAWMSPNTRIVLESTPLISSVVQTSRGRTRQRTLAQREA
jgi:glycosyltransferase A (GT-A) superfamily protein (DUF2064 family)